MKKINKNWK